MMGRMYLVLLLHNGRLTVMMAHHMMTRGSIVGGAPIVTETTIINTIAVMRHLLSMMVMVMMKELVVMGVVVMMCSRICIWIPMMVPDHVWIMVVHHSIIEIFILLIHYHFIALLVIFLLLLLFILAARLSGRAQWEFIVWIPIFWNSEWRGLVAMKMTTAANIEMRRWLLLGSRSICCYGRRGVLINITIGIIPYASRLGLFAGR